METSNAR